MVIQGVCHGVQLQGLSILREMHTIFLLLRMVDTAFSTMVTTGEGCHKLPIGRHYQEV